jgi:hypothetical protein
MKKTLYRTMIFVFCALFGLSACAGPAPTATPQPTLVPTATALPRLPSATAVPTSTTIPSPTPLPVYQLGQVNNIGDLTLAVISVAYKVDQVQVVFAAKNLSAIAVQIPARARFVAAPLRGAHLEPDTCAIADAKSSKYFGVPDFSGALQAGEIIKGTLCWKGATSLSGLQVYYAPTSAGKPDLTWDISSQGTVDVPDQLARFDLKPPLHTKGEAVLLNKLRMTFMGYTVNQVTGYAAKILFANIYIENLGDKSFTIKGSFGARFSVKTVDGYRLADQAILSRCDYLAANVEIKPLQNGTYRLCYVLPGATLEPGATLRYISEDPQALVTWVTR